MKIKLRDLTEGQYKKYIDENCNGEKCRSCPFRKVYCRGSRCWIYNKDMYSDKFLDQEIEIEDEPILTDEEKAYLEAVLKPFRKRVKYIYKKVCYVFDVYNTATSYEYLYIVLNKDERNVEDSIQLPSFPIDTIYRKMKKDKKYTLKELGLFKDDR